MFSFYVSVKSDNSILEDMKGGGSNKFRVKNLFLSLFALLCFSFALWAWDQTPVLTTLLPPSADSDTPFVSPVISMVSPEIRNTQLQSFTMDSQSDSSTKKNISAAAKSKESHNQTFEMTKEEDKLKMVTSEKKGLYKSNGFLKVSCNGGLNQMRSAICDMVAVAHLLNLTLVVPELDKTSFWSDRSQFSEIFNLEHFINSLKDDVRMIKRLPKRLSRNPNDSFSLFPVSWSTEKYYLEQILPLFNKYNVIHFKKSDARLANNCLPAELQKLRCRVNYHALKFTPQLEALGNKLVDILQGEGPFVALHLRYEMDMLAFSGCTHGCSEEEAKELKRMRYAYPWWREKEINSESRRLQGHCPLTPEETSLVLQALGFGKNTKIYIASGEIYGGDSRLAALRAAFPQLLKKETLLNFEDLRHFSNHSSQMAALDFIVSLASDVFIPTYDGNMAKVVEGHRRFLGYKKSIVLDRRSTVQLIDLYENKTLSWDQFVASVREIHETRVGLPACRSVRADKPKEEDSFYANPYECLRNSPTCHAADPAGANASAN